MISGNLSSLEAYVSNKRNAFDVFIGSISFERRCLGAALNIIKSSNSIGNIYFLDYNYALPVTTHRNASRVMESRKKRVQLQGQNKKILLDLFQKNAEFPHMKIEDPIVDTIRCLEQFCNDKQIQINKAEQICIDISTFTKPLIFLLLRMLVVNFNKKRFFVVNTIPSKYTPSSLSFNIWGSEIMPAYSGFWNPSNRNVLIAILGFEGHKLSSIIEKWTFNEIIPIIGFPAFYPGLQDRALAANAHVLKKQQPLPAINYAPALDPFKTYRVIKDILDYYGQNYNIGLAPLGPKPMALAAALLAIERDLRVVYTFPQEYSYSYSHEIGESFLYEVELG